MAGHELVQVTCKAEVSKKKWVAKGKLVRVHILYIVAAAAVGGSYT